MTKRRLRINTLIRTQLDAGGRRQESRDKIVSYSLVCREEILRRCARCANQEVRDVWDVWVEMGRF